MVSCITTVNFRFYYIKVFEIHLMNLALADLIGTTIMPLKMFLELMEYSFHPIGHTGCKIISFLPMTTITVSSLTLLVISIDRYIIVRWPLRKEMERWQIVLALLGVWLVAASLSFVYLLDDHIQLYDNPEDALGVKHFCRNYMTPRQNIIHTVVVFVFQLVIPLVALSVLYTLIAFELRRVAHCQLFQQNERDVQLRLKRNRKAALLFFILVTVFYIFVVPSNIFYLMYALGAMSGQDNQTLFVIFTFLQMILMMNSCVNPLIYSNLHTSFRRSTLRLLCSCVFERFKAYQWEQMGDSIRSMVHRSSRSVRGSLQSSRGLLLQSMRRKSAESVSTTATMTSTAKNSNSFASSTSSSRKSLRSQLLLSRCESNNKQQLHSSTSVLPPNQINVRLFTTSKTTNEKKGFEPISSRGEVFPGNLLFTEDDDNIVANDDVFVDDEDKATTNVVDNQTPLLPLISPSNLSCDGRVDVDGQTITTPFSEPPSQQPPSKTEQRRMALKSMREQSTIEEIL